MDEMNIASFSSSLSESFFLAWGWKILFLYCVLQCIMFFSELIWSIEVPFSWRKKLTFLRADTGIYTNETCNVATSSNQATSSRIQHHPTHFTWRYYTPPTPPPPHPSVYHNETCNVATSSNQATSSRIQHHPTHFTWHYYTPPTPPPTPHPPPSVYTNVLSSIASRLRVPRSSGEPPALSLKPYKTHINLRVSCGKRDTSSFSGSRQSLDASTKLGYFHGFGISQRAKRREWMGLGVAGMIITSDDWDHSRKFPAN